MVQAHVFISGSVQGVGYRQFVKSWARKKGVFGWVKNLDDGRVEAVLQGDQVMVDVLLGIIRKGSFLAEVKDMEVTWEDLSEVFSRFEVR